MATAILTDGKLAYYHNSYNITYIWSNEYSKFIYSSHVSMLQLTTRPSKIDYCNFIKFVLIFFSYVNINIKILIHIHIYIPTYRYKSINT